MIAGIGVDITDIARIRILLEKHGLRFMQRILTADEIGFCKKRHDQATCVAGRFAAKEAAFKALSSGRASGIAFKDIEIETADGSPRLNLTGKALTRATQMGVCRFHLSISHDHGCAVAVVILETA